MVSSLFQSNPAAVKKTSQHVLSPALEGYTTPDGGPVDVAGISAGVAPHMQNAIEHKHHHGHGRGS